MNNEIKNLLIEAINYPRPPKIQEVCLPIWNQPFFYKIDKAHALTISYNPTDKGAKTNYPDLLSRYARNKFGSAEEIFDLLYNFKKETCWRKYYDLLLGTLGISSEHIAHMDVSFFPYKTFSDYLNNKSKDDSYRFLQKAIELLSDNLQYILIDGARNEGIVKLFEKDYMLANRAYLPINSGKSHELKIYRHKTLPTKLIYYKCFLFGQTCPSEDCVINLAEFIKTAVSDKENLNMKKCPKCELNYIAGDTEMCSECLKALTIVKDNTKSHKPHPVLQFKEEFTFRNEKGECDGLRGYKAYNSKDDNVGIVFMTNDKRIPAYGNCELCIYPKFRYRYGHYHRIKSHGGSIKWETLCTSLKTHSIYKCYID